ncbi:BQ5605_C008g05048 [Microbotryum silenes-dioicae]|uniref:BQ5605_C008g05048 protein n=1 Tax=Microbotryum silenes-dioicae TaxID=796604 RepID=A0A2X0PE56_9BASI|nr:BQ5605_C008g05048 [Microbotryum silenes-dioicae]
MRSKIGDFPGFYLRASDWAFMGASKDERRIGIPTTARAAGTARSPKLARSPSYSVGHFQVVGALDSCEA